MNDFTNNLAIEKTQQFWSDFYRLKKIKNEPSPFALWCFEKNLFDNARCILELGCGNARDTFFMLHKNISIVAIDGCSTAIQKNIDMLKNQNISVPCEFYAANFENLTDVFNKSKLIHGVDVVYTRFVLHAITEDIEDKVFEFCKQILPIGGKMFHEFRTIRDPLMKQGEMLSEFERLTDHYRRFINPEFFRAKLKSAGWEELFFVESNGLATFENDDPVVARIIVEKI